MSRIMELVTRTFRPNGGPRYSRIPSDTDSDTGPEYTHTDDDTTQLYQELDDLIGHFGPYQRLVCLIALSINVFMGMNAVLPNFAAARPDFRCETCLDPIDTKATNVTDDYMRNHFYTQSTDKCGKTVVDGCFVQKEMLPGYDSGNDTILQKCCPAEGEGQCSTSELDQITPLDNVACGVYVYDEEVYSSTIVTEFNLVCDDSTKASFSTSMYYAGVAVGVFAAGVLSSPFGRRNVAFVGAILSLATAVWSAFCTNITEYTISRFAGGFSFWLCQFALLLYLNELIGSRVRARLDAWGLGMSWTLGQVLMSWPLAFYIRDWKQLQLVVPLFILPLVALLPTVKPSYRWYISRGDADTARKLALHLAERQGSVPTDGEKKKLGQVVTKLTKISIDNARRSNNTSKLLFLIPFKFPHLRLYTCIMMYMWISQAFVYYGLSLNIGNLPGSDITNNAIMGLVELPSYFLSPLILDSKRLGRRKSMGIFTLLGAVCCLASSAFLHFKSCDTNTSEIFGTIFAYLGKLFITGTFQSLYVYTTEIYSTDIRPDCLALCSLAGRIGSVLAPYVNELSHIQSWIPGAIFGALGMVGGVLIFWCPETLGQPLMSSHVEVERYYSGRNRREVE